MKTAAEQPPATPEPRGRGSGRPFAPGNETSRQGGLARAAQQAAQKAAKAAAAERAATLEAEAAAIAATLRAEYGPATAMQLHLIEAFASTVALSRLHRANGNADGMADCARLLGRLANRLGHGDRRRLPNRALPEPFGPSVEDIAAQLGKDE